MTSGLSDSAGTMIELKFDSLNPGHSLRVMTASGLSSLRYSSNTLTSCWPHSKSSATVATRFHGCLATNSAIARGSL